MRLHYLAPRFWVALAGEHGGVDQIAEQHSEVPAFRFRRCQSA
jgi:hypothetical protein